MNIYVFIGIIDECRKLIENPELFKKPKLFVEGEGTY